MGSTTNLDIFVSCAIGLEPVLADELRTILSSDEQDTVPVRQTRAGVWLAADLEGAYRVALWSRVASRVLLPLFECEATVDALYEKARDFDWQPHVQPGCAIAIDFSGTNKAIRHSRFGALKIKDAVADQYSCLSLEPPKLVKEQADIRFSARLQKQKVSVALDFSGSGLHRRGYRERQGVAPLRENLAAALLYRAGWPEIARCQGALFDPMCGSGTLLIEAAMMATDKAPGLERTDWGFLRWPQHDERCWRAILEQARERAQTGKARYRGTILGRDINSYMTRVAKGNAAQADMDGIEFAVGDARQIAPLNIATASDSPDTPLGLVISNAPYGERMGEEQEVAQLFDALGTELVRCCSGWRAGILAANREFGRRMGLHSYKQYQVDNGNLACIFLLFNLSQEARLSDRRDTAPSEGAQMLANRLKKNLNRLKKWLRAEEIKAYRLYDADIPEYAAAIDVYQSHDLHWAVIQEYKAPSSVDANKARHRLNEIETAVQLALQLPAEQITVKARSRQRGSQQYEKLEGLGSSSLTVSEGGASFEVRPDGYLDTGLFLDHRPVRKWLHQHAKGKRFLNLFCYTGAATVQAALGGAKESLSLDMSNTYLDWAARNFRLNKLDLYRHRLKRADCLQYLREAGQDKNGLFDLIFLDPPSFSNSSRMEEVLDIQRDHVELISNAMGLLAKNGCLVFSTNLRRFRMQASELGQYRLQDMTAESFDPDFQRNQKIHQCWQVRHAG